MPERKKVGKDWELILTNPSGDFTIQCVSPNGKEGELIREGTSPPLATKGGAMIPITHAGTQSNLPGTGNVYGRSYGGTDVEAEFFVSP